MGRLGNDLEQISERHLRGRARVDEENHRAPRSLARGWVEHGEAVRFHVIEGELDVGHANRDMGEASAPAVPFDMTRDR
jgi:hypothetical protein